MNLFADENVDRGMVERLRQDGHAVAWVAELSPGISDEEVLRLSSQAGAVLVTEDKDFGELVYRRGLGHAGVVLVRLEGLDNAAKADVVSRAFQDSGGSFPGAFAVVSRDTLRVRRPTAAGNGEAEEPASPP